MVNTRLTAYRESRKDEDRSLLRKVQCWAKKVISKEETSVWTEFCERLNVHTTLVIRSK